MREKRNFPFLCRNHIKIKIPYLESCINFVVYRMIIILNICCRKNKIWFVDRNRRGEGKVNATIYSWSFQFRRFVRLSFPPVKRKPDQHPNGKSKLTRWKTCDFVVYTFSTTANPSSPPGGIPVNLTSC